MYQAILQEKVALIIVELFNGTAFYCQEYGDFLK